MFCEKFEELKNEKKINDRQFAIQSNIPYSTVRGWTYLNRLPDYIALIKIADFFEISTDELLERENINGIIEVKNELTKNEEHLLIAFRKLTTHDQYRALGYLDSLAN